MNPPRCSGSVAKRPVRVTRSSVAAMCSRAMRSMSSAVTEPGCRSTCSVEAVGQGHEPARPVIGVDGPERTGVDACPDAGGDARAPRVVHPLVQRAQLGIALRLAPELDPDHLRRGLGRRPRRRHLGVGDQLVERRRRRGERIVEPPAEAAGGLDQRRPQQVVAAGEPVGDGARRDVRRGSDVAHRRGLVALRRDEPDGGVEQLLAAERLERDPRHQPERRGPGQAQRPPRPRFASSLATISFWISSVPSQMRSTRRSR